MSTTALSRSTSDAAAPRRRPAAARPALLVAAVLVVAVLVVLSVGVGVLAVSPADVLHGLTGNADGNADGIARAAVQKRFPRTLLALLVGAALGVAGAVMQAVTRNPLADPGLLGISQGASFAVVVGITWFGLHSPSATIWVATAGSAAAAVLVHTIGSLGRGGATPLKLALAGAATAAALTSLVSAVLLPRLDVMNEFRFWQVGGVGGASYDRILQVLPFLVGGALLCGFCTRGLNSLLLGDDVAAGLGENVTRTRLLAATGSVVLCGAATAVAGPIAFVGLVVPTLCRLVVGSDQRWVLPCSAVVGAGLLVAADVVGRVVARPSEVDVGIVTALLGAPVFIAIVRRQKVRAL
ncbi:FecCD family ABC transporter permease [Marmoricola sp. RAF53]|uniref:FecCD family ABC transporter permease n=1 Tax=Marmoricola sp. RAF53 TaxID=3233059 RepID=UPI003F9D249B